MTDDSLRDIPQVGVDGITYPLCCARNEPCEVCGKTAPYLYEVDGMQRCLPCGKRWRVTKTDIVLRLAAKNGPGG